MIVIQYQNYNVLKEYLELEQMKVYEAENEICRQAWYSVCYADW